MLSISTVSTSIEENTISAITNTLSIVSVLKPMSPFVSCARTISTQKRLARSWCSRPRHASYARTAREALLVH